MTIARAISLSTAMVLGTLLLIAATDDGGGFETAISFVESCTWAYANLHY